MKFDRDEIGYPTKVVRLPWPACSQLLSHSSRLLVWSISCYAQSPSTEWHGSTSPASSQPTRDYIKGNPHLCLCRACTFDNPSDSALHTLAHAICMTGCDWGLWDRVHPGHDQLLPPWRLVKEGQHSDTHAKSRPLLRNRSQANEPLEATPTQRAFGDQLSRTFGILGTIRSITSRGLQTVVSVASRLLHARCL